MTEAAVSREGAEHPERLVRVDPLTSDRWLDLVTKSRSDVFHSPAWHRVLNESYGLEPVGRIILDAAGQPRSGIVTCEIDDIRGRRISGLPFSDYCDPLVDSLEHWRRLVADLPDGLPSRFRCLHNDVPLSDAAMEVTGTAYWHAIDLGPSLEQIWAGLKGGARTRIRKAEESGVKIRISTTVDAVRAFFEMHLSVRKHKYGYLAQPYRFFQSIKRNFMDAGDGAILLAELGGEPIGAVLLLTWGGRAYYKFNASRPDRLAGRPNDMLMWHCIRFAKERGMMTLDLGLSDADQPGLIRYKRKFSTQEGTISFLQRPGTIPQGQNQAEIGQLLNALTSIFTSDEVSEEATERAGDLLYRYFA